jgi:hypothetical protein
MITRKVKHVAAFGLALVLVMAPASRSVAASPVSTIYSFGTAQPIDGGVPKGSLTSVNGLLFGRTTTTIATMPTPASTPVGSYGVIFHFNPNNVASSYSIDHIFAGGDLDDGDNPRHDAMTRLTVYCTGPLWRGDTQQRDYLFDRPGWHGLPGAPEPSQLHRRRVA